MDPLESKVQELLSWSQRLGTTLFPAVEIYDDPTTGLSFRSTEDIPKGTRLVTCSYRATLSFLNAVDSPGFPRHTSVSFPTQFLDTLALEDSHIIGHFFLMQQYLCGENSFWWPYIRLLPQPDVPSTIPALWPEEDQRYLDGTNAEPAIKKRTQMWSQDWNKGFSLLKHQFADCGKYTQDLYKWSASTFGSRSFRPSLTIPETAVSNYGHHIAKDKFSVLLPVIDIGNHNGLNNVSWTPDPATETFALLNSGAIRRNEQIFNFYGNKSNSELLVGYGFTLPATSLMDRDVVNLRLKPGLDALELRRSQSCHVRPKEPEEELMFGVQKRIFGRADRRVNGFLPLSDGLVDLVISMVANKRERAYISRHLDHCPERNPDIFETSLARAALQSLQVLQAKLVSEKQRILLFEVSRQPPRNANQQTALYYSNAQLSVLSAVIEKLDSNISSKLCSPLSLPKARHPSRDIVTASSLEDAFHWLQSNYVDVHSTVVKMIAEDQEERLPLNWIVLGEDWDHTYWIVWIFILWMLWAQDEAAFQTCHKTLASWLLEMNSAYDEQIVDPVDEVYFADASEIPTIDLMIRGIMELPQFSSVLSGSQSGSLAADVTRVRNFASYVAQAETVSKPSVLRPMESPVNGIGRQPDQKLLFISKATDFQRSNIPGSWMTFVRQHLDSDKDLQ